MLKVATRSVLVMSQVFQNSVSSLFAGENLSPVLGENALRLSLRCLKNFQFTAVITQRINLITQLKANSCAHKVLVSLARTKGRSTRQCPIVALVAAHKYHAGSHAIFALEKLVHHQADH